MRTVYGIYDSQAQDFIGPLWIYRHETAAIRFFGDVASDQNSMVSKHIHDFALLKVAEINENNDTTGYPAGTVVITGTQWAAAQQPTDTRDLTLQQPGA